MVASPRIHRRHLLGLPDPLERVARKSVCPGGWRLEAGRYGDMIELLACARMKWWHWHRFGAEALARQGAWDAAIAYADGCRAAIRAPKILSGGGVDVPARHPRCSMPNRISVCVSALPRVPEPRLPASVVLLVTLPDLPVV